MKLLSAQVTGTFVVKLPAGVRHAEMNLNEEVQEAAGPRLTMTLTPGASSEIRFY